jgi:sugar lactone lactonase YvrE
LRFSATSQSDSAAARICRIDELKKEKTMNARSVSKSAGRRSGMFIMAILLMLLCFRARASEVTITVTGTLNGGNDYAGVFGGGKMPAGTPYTLVFTFDDSKGRAMSAACPHSSTGITGMRENSPGTATLTINGRSHVFGQMPDARSRTWRTITTFCSSSEIGIDVAEGQGYLPSGVNIKITPVEGERSLTQSLDWRSAVSLSKVYDLNKDNRFAIFRNSAGGTVSSLSIGNVTVSGPREAAAKVNTVVQPKPPTVAAILPAPPAPKASGPEISKIYVLSVDRGFCRVTAYTPQGEKTAPDIPVGGWGCTGIAVDSSGKIYVSRLAQIGHLVCYLPDGQKTKPTIDGVPADGIAVDRNGLMHLLLETDDNYGFIRTLTPEGASVNPTFATRLNHSSGIAVDGSGKLFVVAWGFNEMLKTFDPAGKESTPAIRAGISRPKAVAVGPDGRIYVANHLNVTSYLPDGQRIEPTISYRDPRSGTVESPTGLAVDARGTVYVGWAGGEIGRYEADGKPMGQVFKSIPEVRGIAVH